jgi:predicted HicB family RNase H-like nuclease
MADKPKRKMLAVTMQDELYTACREAAAEADMAVTTWVRECIKAHLRGELDQFKP